MADVFDRIIKDMDKAFRITAKKLDKSLSRTLEDLNKEMKNPRSDITQNDKQVEINIHLPEIKKENITLNMQKDRLEVTAQLSNIKKKKTKSSHSEQRLMHGYHRIIHLPNDLDVDGAKASFSNETLKLIIPKLKKKLHKPLVIR